jgi:hypothetical protein
MKCSTQLWNFVPGYEILYWSMAWRYKITYNNIQSCTEYKTTCMSSKIAELKCKNWSQPTYMPTYVEVSLNDKHARKRVEHLLEQCRVVKFNKSDQNDPPGSTYIIQICLVFTGTKFTTSHSNLSSSTISACATSGPNPTTSIYNASAVKIYNATR